MTNASMTNATLSRRVLEVCDGAVGLSGRARQEYLDLTCRHDAALREQVETLLEAIEESGNFMQIDDSRPNE